MIPQFTTAIKDFFNLGGNVLGFAFPNEGSKYIFSFGITLFIVGFVTWKAHDIKIGLAIFIILSLGFSLFGWLPIWLSIIYIAIGGLYLMRKLFWSSGGGE